MLRCNDIYMIFFLILDYRILRIDKVFSEKTETSYEYLIYSISIFLIEKFKTIWKTWFKNFLVINRKKKHIYYQLFKYEKLLTYLL